MKNMRQVLWTLILALGSSMIVSVPAKAFQDQDRQQRHEQHDRYANSEAYQQGLREGSEDHQVRHHKRKKPHFDRKEDRDAYNQGYKEGNKGNRDRH